LTGVYTTCFATCFAAFFAASRAGGQATTSASAGTAVYAGEVGNREFDRFGHIGWQCCGQGLAQFFQAKRLFTAKFEK
jgi:hypothetical protein